MAATNVQPPCHFPPAFHSDFVIHYRGTSFHVHKFILSCHSSYFRTYRQQLADGLRAYPTTECNEHADIAHCIRVPDSCGKLDASSDDFRLFLCHLYFADCYGCMSFRPVTDVVMAAQPPPLVSLTCPSLPAGKSLAMQRPAVLRSQTAQSVRVGPIAVSLLRLLRAAVSR